MRTLQTLAAVALLALAASSVGIAGVEAARTRSRRAPRARNVIVMISDGCGYRHVEAANLWAHGTRGAQGYEAWPVCVGVRTQPLGRDGMLAARPTDSAAAGTAMSTATKTLCGALGVDIHGRAALHLLERAETLGKATGVVTSVTFAHATPASFVVHHPRRNHYERIARQMIYRSPIDLVFGCGHPFFRNDGRPLDAPCTFAYVGGEATWRDLTSEQGALGIDADDDGTPDRWTLVQSRDAFLDLRLGDTPRRVIGIPEVHTTLQQGRPRGQVAQPFADPPVPTVPTLAEMTEAALNVLDDDPDGLFLMIEGGAIDWASHANDAARMIEEQIDFNAAVRAVTRWVESRGGWNDTLVIVTADHECGGLVRQKGGNSLEALENRGAGRVPGLAWNSKGHTTDPVPLYAKGAGSRLFVLYVEGDGVPWGPTVDNTAIAHVVARAMR